MTKITLTTAALFTTLATTHVSAQTAEPKLTEFDSEIVSCLEKQDEESCTKDVLKRILDSKPLDIYIVNLKNHVENPNNTSLPKYNKNILTPR